MLSRDRITAVDDTTIGRSAARLRRRCGLVGTIGGLGARDFVHEALQKLMSGDRRLDASISLEDNLVAIGQSLVWNERRKRRAERPSDAASPDEPAAIEAPTNHAADDLRAAMRRATKALESGSSPSRTTRDGAMFARTLIARLDAEQPNEPQDIAAALGWRPARAYAAWRKIKETLRAIYGPGREGSGHARD